MTETKTQKIQYYTQRLVEEKSAYEIYNWCLENQIPNPIDANELHCSVITAVEPPVGYVPNVEQVTILPMQLRIQMLGMAMTLVFLSQSLKNSHLAAMNHGAQFFYPSFISHISVSYLVPEDFDVSTVKLPYFPITLNSEYESTYTMVRSSLFATAA